MLNQSNLQRKRSTISTETGAIATFPFLPYRAIFVTAALNLAILQVVRAQDRPPSDPALLLTTYSVRSTIPDTLSDASPVLVDGLSIRRENPHTIRYCLSRPLSAYDWNSDSTDRAAIYSDSLAHAIVTHHSQPFHVHMADSSLVHVNYETSFGYPVFFGLRSTTVQLSGEAYFCISTGSKAPIDVNLKKCCVRLYPGTRVNINAYADVSSSVITVLSGHADILHHKHTTPLAAFEAARLEEGQLHVSKTPYPELTTRWLNDSPVFDFDNEPAIDVLQAFCRWHELALVKTPFKPGHITGGCRYDLPVSDQIGIFNDVMREKAHAFLEGRTVTVYNVVKKY